MRNPDHPIWQILRSLMQLATLTVILWFCADSFDRTEIKTIALCAGAQALGFAPKIMKTGN